MLAMAQYTPDQHQIQGAYPGGLQQLNLPPIRSDHAGPAGSGPVPAPTSTHPTAPPMGMPYHWPPGAMYPGMQPDPNEPLRYPIAPADSRMMSGGRHKKEIKRRTKTGCLTCRKRRIKVRCSIFFRFFLTIECSWHDSTFVHGRFRSLV